jgi:hypothetical protein
MAPKLAEQLGIPVYRVFFKKDVQVHFPNWPQRDQLLEDLISAPESEGAALIELLNTYANDKGGFKSDTRLGKLSPELRTAALKYFATPEPHGPPHVFIRGTFPTVQYLERLFRTGALSAIANSPEDPKAYELTRTDWAGLEIACGGDSHRLGIWRKGNVCIKGEGHFENVRVEREDVLMVFPADQAPSKRIVENSLRDGGATIERSAKRTKPMVAAEALAKIFPEGRPSMTGPELTLELKSKAHGIGTVSPRSLTRAISLAWPKSKCAK